MKKTIISSALLMIAAFMTSANASAANASVTSAPVANEGTKITVTTDSNGEVNDVQSADVQWDSSAWHLRDTRSYKNIRTSPNGKVCMRLKANTQYEIYAYDVYDGWMVVSSIYNMSEGYWVRLHDSSTGDYWMSLNLVY